jgi:hypothetical protein
MKPDPYHHEDAKSTGTPTEEQVDMKDTVGQRVNRAGDKIEDIAGTGEQDSKGG